MCECRCCKVASHSNVVAGWEERSCCCSRSRFSSEEKIQNWFTYVLWLCNWICKLFSAVTRQSCFSPETIVPKLCYANAKAFKAVRETLLFFYNKKKRFCFYLSGSVNKLLHFCVLLLLVSRNGHYNFSQPCCLCRICDKSGLPNFWSNDIGRATIDLEPNISTAEVNFILFPKKNYFCLHQERIQAIGGIRDIRPFCLPLFGQSSAVKNTLSLLQ